MKKFALALIACIILFVLSVGCALVGLVGSAVYAYIETAEPVTDEQLIAKASNRTTLIYDAKGSIMQKLTGKDNMDCEPVTDKEVPQYLKDAIISIEDERFTSIRRGYTGCDQRDPGFRQEHTHGKQ